MIIINGRVNKATCRIGKKAYKEMLEIATQTGLMPDDRENLDTYNSVSKDLFETAARNLKKGLIMAYDLGKKGKGRVNK